MPAALPPAFSAEDRLLLGLAEAVLSGDGRARIGGALAEGVRWPRLVQEAERHAMVPLVYHGLKAMRPEAAPPATMRRLRQLFLATFQLSLHLRSALPEVLRRFAASGIDPLVFKGPALAATAYPDAKLRPFTDLDLLVRPADARAADAALTEAGFERIDPLPQRFAARWERYGPFQAPHQNAIGYVRGKGTPGVVAVDLHWGLASRYFLFPMDTEELWARRVPLRLDAAAPAYTFSPEDTLLFLCVHAAKHHWNTLRFAGDLAALVQAQPGLDWAWTLRKALALRSARMVLLGACLASALLHAPLPPAVKEAVRRDEAVPALAEDVTRALFAPPEGLRGLLRTCRFHLRVRDRARDGLGACWYQTQLALRPTRADRAWLPLPPMLTPLYALIRPARLLWEARPGRR